MAGLTFRQFFPYKSLRFELPNLNLTNALYLLISAFYKDTLIARAYGSGNVAQWKLILLLSFR